MMSPFLKAVQAGKSYLMNPLKPMPGGSNILKGEFALGLGGLGGEVFARNREENALQRRGKSAYARLIDRQQYEQFEFEKLLKQVEENTQRIMEQKPELAQQLLAGRRLPRGAVVIGGTPRTDILDQVAMSMAQAQNNTPRDFDDPVAGALF